MPDGMQLSNALTIDINKARVLDNLLEDCLSSISYMSSKVKIQFPPRSGGGIERKGDRRIPTFYFKRVRGGGRGRGRGQDLAAAAVITLDLTGKTHPMADFVDFTALTSGVVYPSDNLTRLGVMGACMYSTIEIVIRTPAISRRFVKAGKIMGRIYLSCHIP